MWRSNQLSYRTIHAEEGFVEDAQFLSIPIIKQTKRTRSLKGNKRLGIDFLVFQKKLILIIGQPSPERRCSSRTFRYGYLVTT